MKTRNVFLTMFMMSLSVWAVSSEFTMQGLYDFVAENPPSPELHVENISIDVVNTIAIAKIEITKWLDHHFTDQFTLFKENGKWVIVSKVFHTH